MSGRKPSAESSSTSLSTDNYGETKTYVPGGYQSVRESLSQIALGVNPKARNQSRIFIVALVILFVIIVVLLILAIDAKILLDDMNSKMSTLVDCTEVMLTIMEVEQNALIAGGNRVDHNAFLMCTVLAKLGMNPTIGGILGVDFGLGTTNQNPCCPVYGDCDQRFKTANTAWATGNDLVAGTSTV